MNKAKIYVISSQDIFRAGVITIARNDPSLELMGDATRIEDAIRQIKDNSPDLVILDLQDCNLTHELSQWFREGGPLTPNAIVITSTSTDYELTQCIQSGVRGIVSRNVARTELITAIRKVLAGRDHYCSYTHAKLRKDRKSYSLTKRELEVLQLLAFGMTNKEIADRLVVGIGTIKTHLININAKLRVATRTEAVIRGVQHRLISI